VKSVGVEKENEIRQCFFLIREEMYVENLNYKLDDSLNDEILNSGKFETDSCKVYYLLGYDVM
jgi:hypothetical protein